MALHRRLHPHVVARRQCLRRHEVVRQRRLRPEQRAVEAHGVVRHLLLPQAAVRVLHPARVGQREDRLDPARHVVRPKRDGARGRDGGQQRVADAMLGDGRAHVGVQPPHGFPGQVGVPVVQRECALLRRQCRGRQVRRPVDPRRPAVREPHRLVRAVGRPAHDQRVRQPRDAQADPPLGMGLLPLRREREAGHVDRVVQHPHRGRHQVVQRRLVQPRRRGEGVEHHAPYAGNGCSPHGLVEWIVSQYARLLRALMRSMNRTPGSA